MSSLARYLALVAAGLVAACASDPVADRTPPAAEAPQPAPASAQPASASGAASAAPRTSRITLVTGDLVVVTHGGGREPVLSVQPGPGREQIQFVSRVTHRGGGEELIVLPTDAVPLVIAGRLDETLFNVTELVRQGFDDAQTAALPLLVTYAGSPPRSIASNGARGGARAKRWLASVRGEAVETDKRDAGAFWRWLRDDATIAKVWLDARASLYLDESAPQIGAPAAWAAGLTGRGVTVAVLDTGVRASHPDLAGRILEAVDFTDTRPDADDDVGHGTHVAGIIAGSGAASGGRYKGIAPDAALVIGKVCVPGGCPLSAIIAGMEWAAARARIVNMSLGSPASTDGTDPLSAAVNQLSAQYGTLFVVAAGNAGRDRSVGAPAAADAALAVGSVSKQDALSPFSSRGPRFGDYAVKPEIAAPGGAIVAARAAGTQVGDLDPVGDAYARLSGTSMATPHVAGGAALLAQQHPDWDATRLKAVLMSTARPLPGLRVVEQGAGRLDVARATTQRVVGTPGSLSFGVVPFPHDGAARTGTVTYHNDGDADVRLALSLDVVDEAGRPAPAGLFAVAPAEVLVPAHGSADATVSVAGRADFIGYLTGRLTATDGTAAVQTALAVFDEPERFNLTIETLDRSGAQATWTFGFALNLADARTESIIAVSPLTLRLDRGEYDVNEIVYDNGVQIFGASPSIVLDRDRTVTIDGRTARPLTAVVDRPAATLLYSSISLHSRARNEVGGTVLTLSPTPQWATPTAPVTDHRFALDFRAWLGPAPTPPGAAPAEDFLYNLTFGIEGGVPEQLTFRVRDRELGVVHARYFAAGDVRGIRSSFGRTPDDASAYLAIFEQPVPGRRVEYYTAGVPWTETLQQLSPHSPGPILFGERTEGDATYQAGRHYLHDWNRAPFGPSFGLHRNGWGVYRKSDQLIVYLSPFAPAEPGHAILRWGGTTTLSRDGAVVGTAPYAGYGAFPVAAEPGAYTLDIHAPRQVAFSDLGTGLDATWTFRSGRASDAAAHPLPLLIVDATLPVDDHDQAFAGLPYVMALEVQRQAGAPAAALDELTVDVSYDDGATWTRAPTVFAGDRGLALVFHPRAPGFVSLRAHARDEDGNAVTQTVARAYRTRSLR